MKFWNWFKKKKKVEKEEKFNGEYFLWRSEINKLLYIHNNPDEFKHLTHEEYVDIIKNI